MGGERAVPRGSSNQSLLKPRERSYGRERGEGEAQGPGPPFKLLPPFPQAPNCALLPWVSPFRAETPELPTTWGSREEGTAPALARI